MASARTMLHAIERSRRDRRSSRMKVNAARALVAAALLVAVAAPATADSTRFDTPAVLPGDAVSGQPFDAHLFTVACNGPVAFAVVPTAAGADIRYVDPGCAIPEGLRSYFDLKIPALPAGARTLRVVNVGDPLHPEVQDQATVQVAPSPCAEGTLC